MASGKVKLEKNWMGIGVDAEVPSWSEFSVLRRKLEELQQVVTAGYSELKSSLANTDRHLNDVIDSYHELDRTTGQLSEQISRLAEAQESLEQYRERIAQNIAGEIAPLIDGQINRFYNTAKEITDHATKTKEWFAETTRDLAKESSERLENARKQYEVLAKGLGKLDSETSRISSTIAAMENEANSAKESFEETAKHALNALITQVQCISNEAKQSLTKDVNDLRQLLKTQREQLDSVRTECSKLLEEARKESSSAALILESFRAASQTIGDVIKVAEKLNQHSWRGLWDRIVWILLGECSMNTKKSNNPSHIP